MAPTPGGSSRSCCKNAGATRVVFTVSTRDGWEQLDCEVDGEALGFEDPRRVLFSLYASSKESSMARCPMRSASSGRSPTGCWCACAVASTTMPWNAGSPTRWSSRRVVCGREMHRRSASRF